MFVVMAKSAGILLALGFALLPPAMADDGHGGSAQGAKVQTLARSDRSWNAVTARKDDAPVAYQVSTTNVAGWFWISGVGGLIQTTSG